jgi:hypothetical protein
VAVIGADRVQILRNTIRGNNPPVEGASAFPSSGVTVLDGTLVGWEAPERVLVARNWFRNDLDVFWDGSGSAIRFRSNRCRTSTPGGLCD